MALKRVKPGHKLYEVDLKTGGVGLAELNPEPLRRKVNEMHEEQLQLKKGVVRFYERPGFLYFSALNVTSVRKQFLNLVQKLKNGR